MIPGFGIAENEAMARAACLKCPLCSGLFKSSGVGCTGWSCMGNSCGCTGKQPGDPCLCTPSGVLRGFMW
jgi:hypothetical protein